jgi:hypothetical protein
MNGRLVTPVEKLANAYLPVQRIARPFQENLATK